MAKSWRLRLLIGRIGRVSPAELLGVPEQADWGTIHARYLALVTELRSTDVSDPATRRRVAILLAALADAYQVLATTRLPALQRRAH
jgi:hypothetical protein